MRENVIYPNARMQKEHNKEAVKLPETNKRFELTQLKTVFQNIQSNHKTVGVIGGCFDVLHMGHIDLFRYAKQNVDYLCIVLDNDISIRASKGDSRPMFVEDIRADQLAELESVDIVSVWDQLMPAGSNLTDTLWHNLLAETKPDFHITNMIVDDFWQQKENLCQELGIQFLGYRRERISSSTEIIDEIMVSFK